jgi:iron complex outermembrane receptor protein
MRNVLMRTSRGALVGVLLSAQVTVSAQDGSTDTAPVAALEVITVTAQKRTQSSQAVPIGIAALTGDSMEESGVSDVFDVAIRVPSLGVQNTQKPLNTQFRVRGIGNFGNIPNFEPAVAYFSDGAFRSRSGLGVGDLVDLDRVEILKGPQSTLYGKNSTAGVIAVYTREPGRELHVSGELGASNVKGAEYAATWVAKGALSGPVSDSLRLGASAAYYDQDFTMEDPRTGEGTNETQRYAVRGQAVFEPSDAFTVRLIAAHSEMPDSKGNNEPDMFYGNAPAAINEAFGDSCPDNDPMNRRVCRNYAAEVTFDASEATLIATYRFAKDYELTSLTSWDEYELTQGSDADQLNISLLDFNDRQAGDAFQQELRIASPATGALQWIAGAFYYDSSSERGGWDGHSTFVLGSEAPLIPLAPGLPFGEPGDSGDLMSKNDTEYLGVFAQATCNMTERFLVTAGARWQTERKDTTVTHSLNHSTPTLISLALLPDTVDADLSRETDAVTWSLTPQYFFADDVMGYLTASHGFKSGGFNGDWGRALPEQREFADEEVDHYELGLKTRFANDRVQLNAAAFYSDFTNYQEAGFIALQFLVTNAPAVTSQGVEIDLIAQLTDTLVAELNGTYARTEYDDFTEGLCYPGRTPTNAATRSCDLSGATLANAPELKLHASLAYDRPTSFGGFYARTDYSWSDDYFTNVNHDPRHVQNAFGLLDARVGLSIGDWDLSVWGENLTDEAYVYQSAVTNLFGSDPAYQAFLAPGVSYGATARYRF